MTIGDTFGPAERRPQLRGVSGWLLFLCIVLMVFLPLRLALLGWVLIRSASAPNPLGIFALLFLIAVLSIGVVAGVLLYRERPLGVLLAKIFFSIQLVFGVVAVVGNPETALNTFLQVLPSAAWLAYLFRSERVRNTYSRDTSREAAEVFR